MLNIFLIPLGILSFAFVLTVVLALYETRMVWAYGAPEVQPQFGDPTGYGAVWLADALQAGFNFSGWCPDLKGPRYRVSYALLASQRGDCFGVIGVGSILNIPLRGTWLYTRGADGRMYNTTDNQSCVEVDVSRQGLNQLARVNTFSGLLERHRDWLRDHGVIARPFNPGMEAEEFRRAREERFQNMARQGLIAFTDHSGTHWRYTFYGALKLACLNYSVGLLRSLTGGRIPKSA